MLALCAALLGVTDGKSEVWVDKAATKSRLGAVRLGDGCRHIFLDVGSNRGVHVRFLMEGAEVFPHSRYLMWGFFAEIFGPSFLADRTVCAFAFEPNDLHVRRLRHLSQRLRARGRRVEVIHAAASGEAGALTFFHRTDESSESNHSVGFGATPEVKQNRSLDHQTIRLPAVDLGLFIQSELMGRSIPPPPSEVPAADVRPPSIIMKLDPEGAELAQTQQKANY